MPKRRLNSFTTTVTWPNAATGSQVHAHKLMHQRVVNATKFHLLARQPMREVCDAIPIPSDGIV